MQPPLQCGGKAVPGSLPIPRASLAPPSRPLAITANPLADVDQSSGKPERPNPGPQAGESNNKWHVSTPAG